MKKYLIVLLCLAAMSIRAQSVYDVAKYFGGELNGTARFVGMGGAMSALGADISVMSSNPAGIGLYRSNDLAVSASINTLENKATHAGSVCNSEKTYFSLDDIGVVLVLEPDMDAVSHLNIGLNYKRHSNLRGEFAMAGAAVGGASQMHIMQQLYHQSPFDMASMTWENYTSGGNYWLALLGADGGLFDTAPDADGALLYSPSHLDFRSEEEGGVDEVDLNMAVNLGDRLYLGLTVGCRNVDYSRRTSYSEYDEVGRIYELRNRYETTGEGFDLKIGAILRPIEESSLRFGIAFHTPVWYTLTDRSSADIDGPGSEFSTGYMDTRDYDYAYGDDMYIDYRLTTPLRVNVSAAYTVGSFLALGAEYEYADYTKAGIEYSDGGTMSDVEYDIESGLRCVNTYRIGAEANLGGGLMLRAGYNRSDAPFRGGLEKTYFTPDDTRTEYMNRMDTHSYTLGMGYSSGRFYADAAFLHSRQTALFSPFVDLTGCMPATSVTTQCNRLMLTIGMRFGGE